MNLEETLQNLGLNEKEAKVYLALLQLGRSTAYQIAQKSGLKKPTTYFVLDELAVRGIVNKIPKTKVVQYSAISPEYLLARARNKINLAEQSLPELKVLARGGKYKTKVSYYEGLSGIKEMYQILLKEMAEKEYVGFYAHLKNAPEELKDYLNEFIKEAGRKRIKRRAITTLDSSIKHLLTKEAAKKYGVKFKALDEKRYDSSISIEIYKNITQIISHRYLEGIIIDNPDIAKVMRQIFELVWNKENFFGK